MSQNITNSTGFAFLVTESVSVGQEGMSRKHLKPILFIVICLYLLTSAVQKML